MKIFLCLIIIHAGLIFSAHSQSAGSIDSVYGVNGMVITSFQDSSFTTNATAMQTDGKLIVAGTLNNTSVMVIRYNKNGSLDTGFGQEGKVYATLIGAHTLSRDVAVQEDGKIVVAANTADENYLKFGIAVYRFNSDGSPDAGFGVDGEVETHFGSCGVNAVVIQEDGKVLISGSIDLDVKSPMLLVRYLPDGNLDESFGNDGRVIRSLPENILDYQLYGFRVAVQPDGKILSDGRLTINASSYYYVARFNEDGSFDENFADNGIFQSGFSGNVSGVLDFAAQDDGKIICVGYGPTQHNPDIHLFRLSDSGALDNSFGDDGFIVTQLSNHSDLYEPSLALQSDGKIIVTASDRSGMVYQFLIVRYNQDGSIDTEFGDNGLFETAMPSDVIPADCELQPDGKLIAGGEIYHAGLYFPFIIRLNTDPEFRAMYQNENSSGIFIHPTLVSDQSTLEMDLNNEAMISIELSDLSGRMINRFVSFRTYEPGHYSESLDFSGLPSGIYIIRFAANDEYTNFRIVKE